MLAADAAPRAPPLGGLLTALYLLLLLHLAGALTAALPRACGLARLERRWTDLWMR